MSDIVERLRKAAWCESDVKEAADEIEKLRAELRDADEMLLKQARTIRDYQDEAAALKETGND